jgi:hypothetical protein
VPDQGEQVDAECAEVDRDLPDSLCGVGVEQHPVGVSGADEFLDGLDGSGLVVRQHDGHQGGAWRDRGLQFLRINQAVPIDGQDGDLSAVQPMQGGASR